MPSPTRRSRRIGAVALFALVLVAAVAPRVARVYLPTGWRLAPAGDPTPVGDMLAGGVASPDGAWLAFASVGQGTHKVYVLHRADGRLADTMAIGQGWIGMAWAPDSRRLFVSGGTTARILRLDVGPDGKLSRPDSIAIPDIARNKGWLAGLAVSGTTAYVAVSASDKLLKVDLTAGRVIGALSFDA